MKHEKYTVICSSDMAYFIHMLMKHCDLNL